LPGLGPEEAPPSTWKRATERWTGRPVPLAQKRSTFL